jgi:hypothetical protein
MLLACLRIDDVYCLVSTGQTIPDEGKQHTILFLIVGKKCTDVAHSTELRASKRNWPQRSLHLQVLH